MPLYKVKAPDGSVLDVNAPEGATEQQAIEFAASVWKPKEMTVEPHQQQFGERLQADIEAIPRQTGLAARYAIEGISSTPDIIAAPVIGAVNKLLPASAQQMTFGQIGTALANKLGLPIPQNPTEQTVGEAAKMLASSGALVKGAGIAAQASSGAIKEVMNALASRPELQAASAIGGGLAGGYAKETGGGPGAQLAATVAGGLAAPGALSAGLKTAAKGQAISKALEPEQINNVIQSALKDSRIDIKNIPVEIVSSLQNDIVRASQVGEISKDALKRLVDYRLTGAVPARGNLTLTPADITQQKNLSKIGINSNNPALHVLANRQNENVGEFINRLNELGGGAEVGARPGMKLIKAIEKPISKKEQEIRGAYELARGLEGKSAKIDHYAFTQRAGDLLQENLSEGFLPSEIRTHLNDIATGEIPLTVSTAEQLKTIIGRQQRGSLDGNQRYALGLVRQALDEAPLIEGQGKAAIEAFNAARGMHREWMKKIENTPALKDVMEGASPDEFVKKHVINSDLVELAHLKQTVKDNPEAIGLMKDQILTHLKRAAVGVNPDEARIFSQSGFNKALDSIGDAKLRMFLNKEEFAKIKALGRTSLWEQAQPVGSAVNNSNTAGAVVNYIDDIMKKIPFGKQAISDPMENILNSMRGKQISDIPNALINKQIKQRNRLGTIPAALLVAPAQQTNQ